jgi:dTDP-4-dehydrorhamnose 3,5-epimerase-like enzyme
MWMTRAPDAASTPTPASAALDRHASLATTTPPSLRGAEGDAAIQPGASAAAAAPITAAPSSGAVTGSPPATLRSRLKANFARDDGNYPSLRGAEGDAAIQGGASTPTAASPASAPLDRHGLRPRDDGADAADGAGDDKPTFDTITPQYTTTVGEVARLIQAFAASRDNLLTERVGTGLVRALYATYVSYLPVESFAYPVPMHGDARGVFVEMLRTPDCGQFSFFTAHPGITRGGHYHHSKTEKFLVIQGQARFKFRHMQTGQAHELVTDGARAQIVETVPGWTHDITNIGPDELVVMLWANELFDRDKPDTFACAL